MPPKRRAIPERDRSTYRCGLRSAARKSTYVTRLTTARDEADRVSLHTFGIIMLHAVMHGAAFSGPEEFITEETIYAIQKSLYEKSRSEVELPPNVAAAVDAYTQRTPSAKIADKMFSGLSRTLTYQATTIHTAVSNALKYGTRSRQLVYLRGKYALSKRHAKLVADRIGTSVAGRAEHAMRIIRDRAYGRLCRAQRAAATENATDIQKRELEAAEVALARAEASTSIEDADAISAIASKTPLPRTEVAVLLREVIRRETPLVPVTDGECDQLAHAIRMLSEIPDGEKRFAILPYPKAAASFIRFDQKNLHSLLGEKKPDAGEHWLYAFFSKKKVKRMLTGRTVVGRSALTDGVQLQVAVMDKAAYDRETLKFENMAKKRKKNASERNEAVVEGDRGDADADEFECVPPPTKKTCPDDRRGSKVPKVPKVPIPSVARDVFKVKDWTKVSAVDPGHSNPYTAAFPSPWTRCDASLPGSRFVFKTLTLGRYYTETGYMKARRLTEKKKKARPDVVAAETTLPQLSSLDPRVLLDALAEHVAARPLLAKFYSEPWALRLRFRGAILKEMVTAREAKVICPTDKHVVAFGNAKFAATRRGLRPAVCGRIKKELVRIAGKRVIDVDEHRTSMLCSICRCEMFHSVKKRDLESGHLRPVHGLFQCPNTRKGGVCHLGGGCWNRDENAAINIWKVFHALKTTGLPPLQFQR